MQPPLPDDEPTRQRELVSLGVLDTPADKRFDRITRLVRHVLDVEIAIVSLTDDGRQWFLSRQGLTLTETPRRASFCAHTLLENQVLWVADARRDERFRDNPLVVGPPRIRFYAGYPLKTRSGRQVGTLCAIGTEPRPLSRFQAEVLADLGAMVELELEAERLEGDALVAFEAGRGERRASLDPVTGSWNLLGFEACYDAIAASLSDLGTPAALLLIQAYHRADPDRAWRRSADEDERIVAVAQALRRSASRLDTLGRIDRARFALLAPGLPAVEVAGHARDLERRVNGFSELAERGLAVRCGYAVVDRARTPMLDDAIAAAVESWAARRPERGSDAA